MTKRFLGCFSLALALFVSGCSDDKGFVPTDGEDGGAVGATDGGGARDGGARTDGGSTDGGSGRADGGSSDGGSVEGRVLTLNGNSPVTVNFGDTVDVGFTLRTTSGAAVQNTVVQFALNTAGGFLAVDRVLTDAAGVGTARFTAGTAVADVTLTASSENASSATVNLQVRIKPTGGLNVNVVSQARIAVTRAEVFLYAFPMGTAAPACSVLNTSNPLPNATLTGSITPVPGASQFPTLTTGSSVSAYVRGYTAGGDLVASGCTDGAMVTGGVTSTINVVLTQLPSVLAGDYDVLMSVNLGNAIPQPYEDYVNLITLALANPAGVAAYYLLRQADASIGTTFLRWTPPGGTQRQATLSEVVANPSTFVTWNFLSTSLDTQLQSTLGATYTQVKTIGQDIRGLITQFEVGAHLRLTTTSNASQYAINESWRSIVFTWRTGCATGDLGCARRPLLLENTSYAPVNVNYNATVSYEPLATTPPVLERYKVLPDSHNVPFSYGALVLIALQQIVFPSITGCTTCRSLGDVFNNIINCGNLGTFIANSINGVVGIPNFVSGTQATTFCTTGLNGLGARLESDALGLTVGGVNPALSSKNQPGIGGGGVFFLVDQNGDLKTELVRDAQLYVQWANPTNPGQTQDLTAPITGHGRESASGCANDAACGAAQSCQLVPHFLEVRALETTCQKAVGTVAGQAVCTMDNQCRSGMCISGTCFAACTGATECGGRVCDPNRANVSLEPVRAGLGSAKGKGCAP